MQLRWKTLGHFLFLHVSSAWPLPQIKHELFLQYVFNGKFCGFIFFFFIRDVFVDEISLCLILVFSILVVIFFSLLHFFFDTSGCSSFSLFKLFYNKLVFYYILLTTNILYMVLFINVNLNMNKSISTAYKSILKISQIQF